MIDEPYSISSQSEVDHVTSGCFLKLLSSYREGLSQNLHRISVENSFGTIQALGCEGVMALPTNQSDVIGLPPGGLPPLSDTSMVTI